MTARCHEDSCSIKWSEVTSPSGPAYKAVVDVDGGDIDNVASATPTIRCGSDGLEVMLSGGAGQILSVAADGLLAVLPAAVVQNISGSPANNGVAPSADSGSTQPSDLYAFTNATGRDAILLISGEMNFRYGVLEDAHSYSYPVNTGQRISAIGGAVPFNAQIAMRFLADVPPVGFPLTPPTTSRKSTRVGIGGMCVPPTAGADRALVKTERVPFFAMIRVAAGATLNMQSDAFFEGPDQTVNVAAAPGVGGPDLVNSGHELWNLQVTAVPI